MNTVQGLAGAFSMNALTGGMTNAVFRCSKPGGENQTVLLRSYGKGTEVCGYFSSCVFPHQLTPASPCGWSWLTMTL